MNLVVGRRAFRFAAPVLWNTLPYELRLLPTLGIFRRILKTHLFRLINTNVS